MNSKNYGIIYMICNTTNNKKYIGLTTSKRGFDGRYSAKGEGIERVYNYYKNQQLNNQFTNEHLLNSIKKYGFGSFKVYEKIDSAESKEELLEKEIKWIHKFNTTNPKKGYNRTIGGDNFLKGEQHPRYNSVTFKCETCGKISTKWRSKYKRSENHFCSEECRMNSKYLAKFGKQNPNYNSKKVNCDYCQTPIVKPVSLISNRNYCSMNCKNKHQKTLLKGTNNPNYNNGEKVAGPKNGRARKVICITTGEVFDCLKDGADKYGIKNNYISSCCRGRQKTAGKLEDGTRLEWKYYDEPK